MATPQAFISFTGVTGIEGGSFTMDRGVAPSTGEISCVPQNIASAIGTLEIRYVYDVASPFQPDFVLAAPYSVITHAAVDGRLLKLQIADFRYWWRFSHVDGEYNKPQGENPLGSVPVENEKTLVELLTLCLEAMPLAHDIGYDLSQVDPAPRPHVEWKADRADLALEELLGQYGYVLVITLAGSIRIVPIGSGVALPNTGAEVTVEYSVETGALPEKIRVACAEVNYQCRFWLEAVGEDSDGSIKPIDQLSYKPAAKGWSELLFPDYPAERIPDAKNAERAKNSVYRWYRVKRPSFSDSPSDTQLSFAPPGYVGDPNTVTSLKRLLPLSPKLNTVTPRSDGEGFEFDKAKVTGVFYLEDGLDDNTANGTECTAGFSLDADRGIVKFSSYIYQLGDDGSVRPADLLLLCTCQVSSTEYGQKEYYAFDFQAGGSVGVHPIERQELVPRVTANYPGQSGAIPGSISSNLDDMQSAAQFHANAALARMAPQNGVVVEYQGIRGIELDGLRRQVQWSVGYGRASSTKASIGVEVNSTEPSYNEYLEIQKRRLEETRNRRTFRRLTSQHKPQESVQ